MENDYIQKMQDRVVEEFDAFKATLLTKTPEEVFEHNYEIHIKTELRESLQYAEYYTEEVLKLLYKYGDGLLDYLYNEFLTSDYASVNTFGETAQFIQDAIEYWEQIEKERIERESYKAMAHINSLKGEMAEITVLQQVGDNDYIVDYNGVKCHALFNWFVCEFYADDIYRIVEE